jgi:subtilase family serine protease
VKAALPLALVALLAACGGGGGGASPAPPAGGTPTVAPTSPASGSTPKPTPTPVPTSTATVAPGGGAPLSGPTYSPSQTVPLNQSWGPNDVANALHFPVQSGYNGGGITIAVVIDSAVNMSDITTFLSYYQIPTVQSRTISTVVLNGASSTPGADQDEASLDVETVASLAPGANVVLVVTKDLSTASLNDAFGRIFENNLAQIVSLSASGCEAASDATQETPLFVEGANKGIAFLTASGDTGNECYVDTVDTVPVFQVGVGYPASDPNVISVGGNETANVSGPTSLTSNVVWNDTLTSDHSQEASGGGVSTVFTPPPFQSGLGGVTPSGRNVPDVAMPAADTAIYLNNQWELVNGTSWASPQFAAMLAEVYQYCNVPASGNTAPAALPYAAYASAASAFVDVTSGNNQYKTSTPFYTATAGYDATSGLGVPLGMPMAQALCPNHTLSSRARGTLSIAQASHRAAEAYQIDETPSVRGLVDEGRRSASATTAIQLVLLPGSSASDEAAVTAVLQSAGLTIAQTFANHLLVDASGPSSAVEQLFGTQLHDVTQGRYGTRYLPVAPATIPASLAPYLSGVVLDNVIVAHAGPLHRR